MTLEPEAPRRFVVITFSGLVGDTTIEKRTNELRRYAADRKLTTIGEPQLAFYNPPLDTAILAPQRDYARTGRNSG